MSRHDYSQFDQRLLDLIGSGVRTYARLTTKTLGAAAPFPGEPARVTDRRLQALRKKGLIVYDSKAGWSLAPPPNP